MSDPPGVQLLESLRFTRVVGHGNVSMVSPQNTTELLCWTSYSRAILNERSFGQPMCLRRYAIRNKTGNQKSFVRNKAIPSRAREPAALSIYAPLRRFHFERISRCYGVQRVNRKLCTDSWLAHERSARVCLAPWFPFVRRGTEKKQ